ncbi:glycoside hydrolase family 53 protein [Caldanaerobius polysaccharolyticus]|nr:arabinogalactan endo-1,4-beta-galactosidase [Caldanaerobius polysaccharolyticus]
MENLFIKGADVSWLKLMEDCGARYYENGQLKDCLEILKNNGINYIRLRIWNNPPFEYCNKQSTLEMVKRLKKLGFKFLLDFHYSDFWADPAKQNKPAAWENLTFNELKDAVYNYTKEVICALKDQGTLPDMVQIGNEITWGMLWPDAKLSRENNGDEQWDKFTDLIKAGVNGVEDSLDSKQWIKIMIHIDRGGDNETSRWFFDNLISKSVEFDVIGLSFYPLWHGTLSMLKDNISDLALRYNKDIVVVECAYPFAINTVEGSQSIINDSSQLHEGYEATPEGQARYVRDLIAIVKGIPQGRGKGVFYWEPDWIKVPNNKADKISINNWYNQALFDFEGNALKALQVFKEF